MKITELILFCVLACFSTVQAHLILQQHGLPPPPAAHVRAVAPKWGTIEQKLDNFDDNETRTWTMRYLTNEQFFQSGGPLFIMLGAEWTIAPGWLQAGQMFDMAKKHNGSMFYTEHRYYGKSIPTKDLSTENLKYLTTEQALADVANFIVQMKKIYPSSKVIVVGGSYGGNMAIWMREKYPNLVHAAVSSSAPVLAKVDFSEYHDVVKNTFPRNCTTAIATSIYRILDRLATIEGTKNMSIDFNLCKTLDRESFNEVTYFFSIIANIFGGIVQYAKKTDIQDTCNDLMKPGLDDYTRMVQFIKNKHGDRCISGYENYRRVMSHVELDRGNSRQWTYQTCTEYGYFQTSKNLSGLYSATIPVKLYYDQCLDVFGPKFTPKLVNDGANKKNTIYGGMNPSVTRVISIHGTVDPWHALGLTHDLNQDAPVIVVPGTSHCADLNSVSKNDSPAMKNAKTAVQTYISKWLQED